MVLETRLPSAALANDIAVLWYFRAGPQPHARERVLPDGGMSLIINLREDALPVFDRRDPRRTEMRRGTLLVGPQAEFVVIDTDAPTEILGVQFKPGGARAWLPFPTDELFDQEINLADIWGDRAAVLREQLIAAPSIELRLQRLELALLGAKDRQRERHVVVAYALRELSRAHTTHVADVVSRSGYSARRFIQLFTTEVGLTPKVFHRMQRFQRIVRRIHSATEPDLADVALECGYYDQSHFVHDFRAFCGTAPTEYLARRRDHPNHAVMY